MNSHAVRRVLVLVGVLFAGACTSARRPVSAPSTANLARLEEADALVRAGCLDCLLAAYRDYNGLRDSSQVGERAAAGAVRAAALIDIRERELGLLDGGYSDIARRVAANSAQVDRAFSTLLEIAAALRLGPEAVRPSSDAQVAAMLHFASMREAWTVSLREAAARELLASYIWLAFACDPLNARSINPQEARALVGDARDTPLLTFGYLASCDHENPAALQRLLDQETRFVEINYLLGLAALRERPRPDVDKADRLFHRASDWRREWPSLTLAIGNLALATEDFDRAFEFFDRTLSLKAEDPGALLGTTRALTYLGRYKEALGAVDLLLTTGRNPGEARYWRAFNENQLGQLDEAWDEIEVARTLMVNAEVPKLAGIIAYKRGDIRTARTKLEEARTRNRTDCEVGFYLHLALADQRDWSSTAAVGSDTGSCFDEAEVRIRGAMHALETSNGDPQRVRRQIARREEELTANGRMRATSWFNTAVALTNLGRYTDARQFALKVLDDQLFADRARALLGTEGR